MNRFKLFFKVLKSYLQYSHDIDLHGFALGVNSSIDLENDIHILPLDYDITDFEKVNESVHELQIYWNLSDAFIYKSKKGFHVFFYFDHMPYTRVKMMINFAKYVDPMYRHISRFYDHKTIRVAGKYKEHDISFFKVIPGSRKPTLKELELGELKKKEHDQLMSFHVGINKDVLI
jgi:hypothetical protein